MISAVWLALAFKAKYLLDTEMNSTSLEPPGVLVFPVAGVAANTGAALLAAPAPVGVDGAST